MVREGRDGGTGGDQRFGVAALLEERFDERQVRVGMIDVGAFPDLADEFGVQSLPTLAVFVGGRQVEALHGYRRAPEIRDVVRRALANPAAGAPPREAGDGEA